MVALTDYAENELLDHIMSTGAWTAPTATYAKLHIGDPTETGAGSPALNTARVAITWGAAAARVISNSADVDWLSVPNAETYSHVSIWDDPTAGNAIAYGALTASQPVNIGDDFSIVVGDLDLSFAGTPLTNYAANSALDHLTGRVAWTMPAGKFVKAHLGDPGADATLAAALELTRANAGPFSAAAAGTSDNDNVIAWSPVGFSETWSHISIWDASTAGNPLWFGPLGSPKAVTAGQNAQFAAGTLDVTLQ